MFACNIKYYYCDGPIMRIVFMTIEQNPEELAELKTSEESEQKTTGAVGDEAEGNGTCASILIAFSVILVILTFPFSLCLCIKVRLLL